MLYCLVSGHELLSALVVSLICYASIVFLVLNFIKNRLKHSQSQLCDHVTRHHLQSLASFLGNSGSQKLVIFLIISARYCFILAAALHYFHENLFLLVLTSNPLGLGSDLQTFDIANTPTYTE